MEVSTTFIIGIGLAYAANRIAMWYLQRKSDRNHMRDFRNRLLGRPYWPSERQ